MEGTQVSGAAGEIGGAVSLDMLHCDPISVFPAERTAFRKSDRHLFRRLAGPASRSAEHCKEQPVTCAAWS